METHNTDIIHIPNFTSTKQQKKRIKAHKDQDLFLWGGGGTVAMVSALDSSLSGPGSNPGRGRCITAVCSWAIVPLNTQGYKKAPSNSMLDRGQPCNGLASHARRI